MVNVGKYNIPCINVMGIERVKTTSPRWVFQHRNRKSSSKSNLNIASKYLYPPLVLSMILILIIKHHQISNSSNICFKILKKANFHKFPSSCLYLVFGRHSFFVVYSTWTPRNPSIPFRRTLLMDWRLPLVAKRKFTNSSESTSPLLGDVGHVDYPQLVGWLVGNPYPFGPRDKMPEQICIEEIFCVYIHALNTVVSIYICIYIYISISIKIWI